MKKNRFSLEVLAAALAFGVFLAGCNTDSGSDPIIISGTLSNGGTAAIQTFHAEIGSDNSISGKLKDGDITFELSGKYDPVTKVFSMQAVSSTIIYSIVGKLNDNNTIDISSVSATVKVKNSQGEWTSTDLTLTAGSQTVDGPVNVNTTDVTAIPVYCQGTWTDQIMAKVGLNLRIIETRNSVTSTNPINGPPLDITVVEVTNTDGSNADENGPWHFIVRVVSANYAYQNFDFTGKFYVSKNWDDKIEAAVGTMTVADLYSAWMPTAPAVQIKNQFSGIRMWVVPYVDSYDNPQFTGDSAAANAKAATKLKAVSMFTLALK
jgi:hypothetical protein